MLEELVFFQSVVDPGFPIDGFDLQCLFPNMFESIHNLLECNFRVRFLLRDVEGRLIGIHHTTNNNLRPLYYPFALIQMFKVEVVHHQLLPLFKKPNELHKVVGSQ